MKLQSLLIAVYYTCTNILTQCTVKADDCYLHLERDGTPCDDHNPATSEDQCFQGVCGGWKAFDSVIPTEQAREAWLSFDPELTACDPNLNAGAASACGCEIVTCR